MAWFHFFKKKEEGQAPACACDAKGTGGIQVLGAGCPSCRTQYENVKKAVRKLNLDVDVAYITDMEKIMGYGVMRLPALAVDGKIVSMGKVLSVAEAEALLQNAEK